MAIINYGHIDKKLIFIIFIMIARTIYIIVVNEVDYELSNNMFCALEEEIGPIIVGIILNFTLKQKQKEKDEKRKNFKYLMCGVPHLIVIPLFFKNFKYLFFLRGIQFCYQKLYYYFIKEEKYD